MRALHLVAIGLLLAACRSESAGPADRGWQSFSLGTMPLRYAPEGEQRYIVSVPRRYLDEKLLPSPRLLDAQGRIVANNIRFGVRYPSLEPAEDPWAKGSIRVTIGNIVEDGISSSVDGSWQNRYSVYSGAVPDAHGLQVRKREDFDPFGDRLYFRITPDLHLRIECNGSVHGPERWCVMAGKRPGEPFLETGFYSTDLPHWRERLARLQTLFRAGGKAPLGSVQEAP